MSQDQRIAKPNQDPARKAATGGLGVWLLLLLLVYAAGLTQSLTEPWVGMHDWNGAFFSQLARNLLRYPMSVHHGMPVVAVGEAVPDPAERSIYATHPPGLVWLVAGAFAVFGESESVARLAPIVASLGTLALMVWLVFRAYGRAVALLSGLLYAVMPMSVYFGRMVDHEAVCLLCMSASIAAWTTIMEDGVSKRTRIAAWAGWIVAIVLGVWIDWSMVLFAGLFCAYAIWEFSHGRIDKRRLIPVLGTISLAVTGMLIYLVYAGLEGRWQDLLSIFFSRAGQGEQGPIQKDTASPGGVGTYTVENLSWPVLLLAAAGFVTSLVARFSRRTRPNSAGNASQQTARAGLVLILVTGAIWLVVFWRQYERHNYWLFYLGPAAAVYSARALKDVWAWLTLRNRYIALLVTGSLTVIATACCILGSRDYFERLSRSYPPEVVSDWRAVQSLTTGGDRVLLFRDPVFVEQRGGYHFRNIVPPQSAYYLDRPFDVERDLSNVSKRRVTHAVFIIPKADAVLHRESLGPLRAQFPENPLELLVVFDLRRPRPNLTQP